MEQLQKNFNTPADEIAYLKAQLALREGKAYGAEVSVHELGKEVLGAYHETQHEHVLTPARIQEFPKVVARHEAVIAETADATPEAQVANVLDMIHTKGVKEGLALLEKLNNAFMTDEVHSALIAEISEGRSVVDVKEETPLWNALHTSLFEVSVASSSDEEGKQADMKELFGAMKTFFMGMQGVGYGGRATSYSIEMAVRAGSDEIVMYVSVPTTAVNMLEKHLLSLFPHATLTLLPHDYNIFGKDSSAYVSVAKLAKHPIYPLASEESFSADPLDVLINVFTKIEREHAGAAVQFIVQVGGKKYIDTYNSILNEVRKGEKPKDAIAKSTMLGSVAHSFKDALFGGSKKPEDEKPKEPDALAIQLFERKVKQEIVNVVMRIATADSTAEKAKHVGKELESAFTQFTDVQSNSLQFVEQRGSDIRRAFRSFSFREFSENHALQLSFDELALLVHFPRQGKAASAQMKQATAKRAPAPLDLPSQGTLLGINSYRGVDTKIFTTPEDRLRHFYIIGQTGTGKTTLMKNMVVQDIINGDGVCMIDPHGSDIAEIMGSIPRERFDDVIYFDPSNMEQVMGLNMLEYDEKKPEQKTFVVNELLSIFKKLYSAESMGPMFEQYFRNAALLILEDPESGSTMLDISRVLADVEFRKMKLAKCHNPVVLQFWNQIAGKAGGEASLENIVPYITSKIDTFTANDYMRPIIGQQTSSFDFRKIMDEKKILLINLSKGRLGELNANLIGMIVVGKILMAALSRVDDMSKSYPPFYLHMDEFQNITTDSISSILSEARKYKLGLTIANQYISQIDQGIRDAIFGNVGSIAAFRIGVDDADIMQKQFDPEFSARDLLTIENRMAYIRMLANGTPTKPFNIATMAPPQSDLAQVEALIQYSSQRFGKPRRLVEMDISSRY